MDIASNIHKGNSIHIFDMDSDITVVKFVIPLGFSDFIQNRGYAHLIEHMVIQANRQYLTSLEKGGIQFNAETKENLTEYMFIDLQNGPLLEELQNGGLRSIFEVSFTAKELDIEKNTITQEHLVLCNQMNGNEVDSMIGSREDIANFDLKRASQLKERNYSRFCTLIFAKADIPESKKEISVGDWFSNVEFQGIEVSNQAAAIQVRKNWYGEILAYCLRIFFGGMIQGYNWKLDRSEECIRIIVMGDIKSLGDTLQYKTKSYSYYYLSLISFKFLCNEVTYIIQYLPNTPDIKTAYLENDWEERLYEKILDKK